MPVRDHVLLYVNGERFCPSNSDVFLTLAEFLRERRGLTGTKVACGEGACGSCTVLLGRPGGEALLRYRPINACLYRVYQADCCWLVTVEGVASSEGALSPVQTAMIEQHGAQCGFCTPGFVMSLSLRSLQGAGTLTAGEVLAGNLCRCTGYLPILNAARVAEATLSLPEEILSPIPTSEVVRELEDSARTSTIVRTQSGEGERFLLRPATLAEAVALRMKYPDATVIAGGTDARESGADVLYLGQIAELASVEVVGNELRIGATVTWEELRIATEKVFPELSRYLRRFGSPQIRATGTVGGSIVSRAPNADILPLLLVQGASVRFAGPDGERTVTVADLLARSALSGEILTKLVLPLPVPDESLRLYKVARRRAFDRSVFCAAVAVRLDEEGCITEARVACGGVGPVAKRLTACEGVLQGATFTPEVMRAAGEAAASEITPVDDAYAGAEYRRLLVANLLLRFYQDAIGDAEGGVAP